MTEDTEWNGVAVNERYKWVSWPSPFFSRIITDTCPPLSVQGDHYKLIRKIDAASTLLLKNVDSALSLSARSIEWLAIVGSGAGPNLDGPNG